MNTLIEIFIIAVGVFTLAASVFNWDWFFNARKAQFLIRIIGRTGARIAYSIISLLLIGGGIGLITGLLK